MTAAKWHNTAPGKTPEASLMWLSAPPRLESGANRCARAPSLLSARMAKTDPKTITPVARIADGDIPQMIERMRSGERRAIASVITELERLSAAAPAVLKALQPHLGHSLVI